MPCAPMQVRNTRDYGDSLAEIKHLGVCADIRFRYFSDKCRHVFGRHLHNAFARRQAVAKLSHDILTWWLANDENGFAVFSKG